MLILFSVEISMYDGVRFFTHYHMCCRSLKFSNSTFRIYSRYRIQVETDLQRFKFYKKCETLRTSILSQENVAYVPNLPVTLVKYTGMRMGRFSATLPYTHSQPQPVGIYRCLR